MISGYWYPAGSSKRYPAQLKFADENYKLEIEQQEPISGSVGKLQISDRVGQITRRITLADQSLFETTDNAGIDQLLESTYHPAARLHILHRLENNWKWIISALLITVIVGFSTIRWGMPWASKHIAYSLPISVHETIAGETLKLLDETLLEPSSLSAAKQQEINQHFQQKLLPLQSEEFNYKLHFRSLPGAPNAFALPSGDIILTDELIELAENQQEIDSVLLHEIGHVAHRHGMQQLLQSSFLTLTLILITGEVSVLEEWVVAFPVFLLKSHYSREHESDADEYAFKKMLQAGINPIHFARIMRRLGDSNFGKLVEEMDKEEGDEASAEDKQTDPVADQLEKSLKYLLSHPPTQHRVDRARMFSRRFAAGTQTHVE